VHRLLGVYFSDTLHFDDHVKYVLTLCCQRCYLLKTLCGNGLSQKHLNTVFQALIISRLAYNLPAWSGFLSKDLVNKINTFLVKTRKCGYTNTVVDFDRLLQTSDITLFKSIQNSSHCINSLLPTKKSLDMSLRRISYELPNYKGTCRHWTGRAELGLIKFTPA